MIFGDFKEDDVFQIEKSKLHSTIGDRIKVVEFLLIKDISKLYFIEAKSSSPQPTEDNKVRFDEYIQEISDKFIHSFNLFYSAILKRNKHHVELSNNFFNLSHDEIEFKFILVIKNHKIDWLLPISDALNRKLSHQNTIWKSKVVIMNYDLATKYNLVKGTY